MTKRRLLLLVPALVVAVPLFVIVGLLVHWLVAPLVAVAAGLAVVWWIRTAARRATTGSVAARVLTPDEEPRLHNVVEGACATHGFAYPTVLLVDTPAVNAAYLGESADDGRLVVTTGLLEHCNLLGLEAVVVNTLIRTRQTDIGAAALLPGVLPLVPSASWRHRLRAWVLGDQPRVRADLASVRITRYPPGLVSVPMGSDGRRP